ncbi:MAG: LysR substrate-binding domain-containing protein [Burkholderiales bacterium]|nr:LysR substrate-binding domain-containing protein [Burkholderiales bacterium]
MKLTSLNYQLVRLYLALMDNHSLSETAKHQHLSMASASRGLAKLDEIIGTPVFTRTFQGMMPTAKAYEIKGVMEKLAASFKELENHKEFNPKDLSETFTIAAADNAAFLILRPVVLEMMKQAPNVSLDIRPLDYSTFDSLRKGGLDLAIYPNVEVPEGFHFLNLFKVKRACLVRKEHPLAIQYRKTGKISIEDIVKYPRIMISDRHSSRDPVYSSDSALLKTQRTVIRIPYFLAAPQFLLQTDYTLLINAPVAEFFALGKEYEAIPFPGVSETLTTRIIWHDRVQKDPANQWLRSLFVGFAGYE